MIEDLLLLVLLALQVDNLSDTYTTASLAFIIFYFKVHGTIVLIH